MHRSKRRGAVGRAGNTLGRLGMDLLTHLTREPLPFAALLGIEIVSAVPDKIVAEMMVRDDAAPGRLCYMVGLSWLLPTH